jgi:hypothetical protein
MERSSLLMDLDSLKGRINGIFGLTIAQKCQECITLVEFFNIRMVLNDLSKDWEGGIIATSAKGAEIPAHIIPLISRAYLEMKACLLGGAYQSVARTLRWMFEASMVGAVSCVSANLLKKCYENTLSFEQFTDLIHELDNRKLHLRRKEIYEKLGLLTTDMTKLYADLCKYSHVSRESVDLAYHWPNLQFLSDQFDKLYNLVLRTMDFVFYMESKLCVHFDGENMNIKLALKKLFDPNYYPTLSMLPLTSKLVNDF